MSYKIQDFFSKNLPLPSQKYSGFVKHNFVGGCYVREVYNPANMLIITKIHKKEHPFFLMEGSMSILTENGIETISAPHNGITKPGTQRVIYANEDSIFVNIHKNPSNTKNIDELEKELVAMSKEEYEKHLKNNTI